MKKTLKSRLRHIRRKGRLAKTKAVKRLEKGFPAWMNNE